MKISKSGGKNMRCKKLPTGFIENLRAQKPRKLTAEQEKLLQSLSEEYPDDVSLQATLERYHNNQQQSYIKYEEMEK